jgi:hypothetical protein
MHNELIFTETEGHKGRTTLEDHGRRIAAQIAERFGPDPVRVRSSSLATTAWEDYNVRYSSITVVETEPARGA